MKPDKCVNQNMLSPISFKGSKTISKKSVQDIANVASCHIDGFLGRVKQNSTKNVFEIVNGETHLVSSSPLKGFFDSCKYPFWEMYKDIGNYLSKKSKSLSFLRSQKQLNLKAKEQELNATKGLYEHGLVFLKEAKKELGVKCEDSCIKPCVDKNCEAKFIEMCDFVTGKFYALFNKNLGADQAQYNTRDERTLARIGSGAIASLALFVDFHNKAARDGATPEKADEAANTKMKQEMIASMGEAAAQFTMLGGFQKYINNSQFGAPIINTLLGLFFHITSRLSTGQPLTRIQTADLGQTKDVTTKEYFDFIKNPQQTKEIISQRPLMEEKEEEHILSLKNIGLACLASVVGGFGLKFGKSKFIKTEFYSKLKKSSSFEKISGWVSRLKDNYEKSTIKNVEIKQDDLDSFFEAVDETGNEEMRKYYMDILGEAFKNNKAEVLHIGQVEKTFRVPFTKIELTRADVFKIPLVPFKIIKETVSYPFKIVEKILTEAKVIGNLTKAEKEAIELKKLEKKAKVDPYDFIHTYMDYKKHRAEFKDDKEFFEFYKEHLETNRLNALNKETKSSVNNAKIGKLTQILGTVISINFATTDDYNRTIRQTGNKKQAEKDARERGINKFVRIVSQIAIMDMINGIFKIPYATSLVGAFTITTFCTVVTDCFSRFLSGMPFVKMDKKEMEEYQKSKETGILSPYYKAIDKLAS